MSHNSNDHREERRAVRSGVNVRMEKRNDRILWRGVQHTRNNVRGAGDG